MLPPSGVTAAMSWTLAPSSYNGATGPTTLVVKMFT